MNNLYYDDTMFGTYWTKTFTEVWPDEEKFITDYNSSFFGSSAGVAMFPFKSNSSAVKATYYLLYARYGNDAIANFDENQFKYKVFNIIATYGPAWEKRLDLQTTFRNLTDAELLEGSMQIYNHAINPGEYGYSTTDDTILTYLNDQNTAKNKRGKLEAYTILWQLINNDVTSEYVDRFKVCFLNMVKPQQTLLYPNAEEDR